MDEFPDNNKFAKGPKPPEKKIVAVVSEPVRTQKTPISRRARELFGGAWNYVFVDVLIPAAKDTAADAVSQGIEKILFGDARSTSRRPLSRSGGIAHTAYNRMYGGSPTPRETAGPRPSAASRPSDGHGFGEIVLATRVDAQETLSQMYTLLSTYDQVSIADLYSLVGIVPNQTDNKFGWISLEGSDIRRLRDGYALELPRPDPL